MLCVQLSMEAQEFTSTEREMGDATARNASLWQKEL